jgi:hypothetical protein
MFFWEAELRFGVYLPNKSILHVRERLWAVQLRPFYLVQGGKVSAPHRPASVAAPGAKRKVIWCHFYCIGED